MVVYLPSGQIYNHSMLPLVYCSRILTTRKRRDLLFTPNLVRVLVLVVSVSVVHHLDDSHGKIDAERVDVAET